MRTSTTLRASDRPDRAPDRGRPAARADARRRPATTAPHGGRRPPRRKLHPGVQVYTKGAQCTDQLRVHRRAPPRLRRVRRALRRQGRGHRHRRLPTTLAPARHPRPVRRGRQRRRRRHHRRPRPARLQLVAHDAPARRRPATPAPPTTSRWCGSSRGDGRKVNPSVPFWGGPVGPLDRAAPPRARRSTPTASPACARPRVLSPKTGASLGSTNGGWGWDVYTATPGIPGDSGSGFLDENGRAVGTLSTVAIAPLAGSNGLGDLQRELRYAQRHSGITGLRLVRGTEPFSPLALSPRGSTGPDGAAAVGSGRMGARRASTSAVVAVVGGCPAGHPARRLGGGDRPRRGAARRRARPSQRDGRPTETPTSTRGAPRRDRGRPRGAATRRVHSDLFFALAVALAACSCSAWLLFGLVQGGPLRPRSRWADAAATASRPPEEVEFDVLDVARGPGRASWPADAAAQRELLRRGHAAQRDRRGAGTGSRPWPRTPARPADRGRRRRSSRCGCWRPSTPTRARSSRLAALYREARFSDHELDRGAPRGGAGGARRDPRRADGDAGGCDR